MKNLIEQELHNALCSTSDKVNISKGLLEHLVDNQTEERNADFEEEHNRVVELCDLHEYELKRLQKYCDKYKKYSVISKKLLEILS